MGCLHPRTAGEPGSHRRHRKQSRQALSGAIPPGPHGKPKGVASINSLLNRSCVLKQESVSFNFVYPPRMVPETQRGLRYSLGVKSPTGSAPCRFVESFWFEDFIRVCNVLLIKSTLHPPASNSSPVASPRSPPDFMRCVFLQPSVRSCCRLSVQ